ncbi:PA14 domain-containing protein, partial [Flavobacterium sp.]|uniref:PA14 domain-containing protein n=1 Tax=Flavobacterium sp. TaxID=239 RepID=UPI002624DE3B
MCSYAQNYPGGINTGQVKGWRAEAYWGHAINNNPALFGQGTANAIGELWGFTDYINGNEFTAIRGDNFSVEYTATLNITTAGVYQFRLSSVDDYTWLYIDGVQVAFANTAGAGTNSGYQSINLSAGEHAIKVKFSEGGGAQNFDINWQGNGIPANTRLDARYVYIKDVPMSHWLNLDGAITTTVGGSQRIQRITNKAANGTNQEMMYNGSGWTGLFETENVNFNGVSRHSGDDHFRIYNSSNTLGKRYTNGLVLRGTPYTHLLSASHHTSPESASLLIGYGRSCGTNSTRSFYKTNTYISHDVYDIRTTTPFTFKTNEPYVVNGWSEYTATAQSNFHVALNTASSQGVLNNVTTANLTTSLNGLQTLVCNTGANNFSFQEYIYYPFQLDATQLKKVNTYMAIKWGTNFSQNWIAPNNTIVWDKEGTANTGYQNRVFGIAADASNGNLNQKQSQSQVRTAEADYQNTYLTISKGAIATSNTTNTATIPDGSYLLVGDNGAVLTNQSNDIPSSFSGCIFGRIAREWKARVTGTPGAVTLRAGSNNAGSAVFSGNATGIQLMIDEDGNGNFTNGTIRTYNYTSLVNGIATFENVTLNDGEVFTFVYKIIAPGGVSRPTAGTLIGSDTYVNGLEYKLYSGFNTTPENGMTGVLLSSGYTNSDFNFDDNVETKIGDNFQLQLTGKIQIQTAGNYSFRFQNLDDEASVHINGVLVHFGNCCGTTAGGTITLTAGYHDIDIRFSESGGVNTLQMQYSGPDNGSTWGQVPDNRYFVLPFGPSAWFSTTAGSFDGFADGAAISNGTIWRDLSLYGNNLTLTQGDPVFKKTSNLRNYNQQLRFDDDRFSNTGYLNGFAYGRQGKTNFSVQGFSSTTASEEVLFGWGIGTTGGLQGIFTNNLGNIIYFGFGSDYNLGTAHFTGTYKHSIVNTMYRNFGISSTNNGFGFVD